MVDNSEPNPKLSKYRLAMRWGIYASPGAEGIKIMLRINMIEMPKDKKRYTFLFFIFN
jgi:hypothetical protein